MTAFPFPPIQLRFYPDWVIPFKDIYHYDLAGRLVASDMALPEITAYYLDRITSDVENLAECSPYQYPVDEHKTIQINGWLDNSWREIEISTAVTGYLLKIDRLFHIHINPQGDRVCLWTDKDEISQRLVTEAMLGPGLITAMAINKTWSLHTSAVSFNDTLIAFLGKSGSGKSTLAHFLSNREDGGWQLVCDDILPVHQIGEKIIAYPGFPQLKILPSAQPASRLPLQIELNCIIWLDPGYIVDSPLQLQLLSSQATAQVIIQHTVASRLFTLDLLKSHLDFSLNTSLKVPGYRLDYPHDCDRLPEIQHLLERTIREKFTR
jgi:hypothetical protein